MDWSDVLKLALSIFLVATGLGLAYVFLRMAGVFARLGTSVTRVTDEVVPLLNRAQTTIDGVNLELARVDEMMQTAVNATKGAEKTVQTVSSAVTAPVRKLTGLAAGVRQSMATLRARRAADAADRAAAAAQAADRAADAAAEAARDAAPGAPVTGTPPAAAPTTAPTTAPATDQADTGSTPRPATKHKSPY